MRGSLTVMLDLDSDFGASTTSTSVYNASLHLEEDFTQY